MAKVSIIIPARNEKYLLPTVQDLIANSAGEIEIIPVIDGPSQWMVPQQTEIIRPLVHDRPLGMRTCINEAVKLSTGEWLMKCDAHCCFGQGYDHFLQEYCEKNWVAVPRRYALDVDNWGIDPKQPATDAHYLQYPWLREPPCFHGVKWPERTKARQEFKIDDEMDSQGSCWFMHCSHFREMSTANYGDFFQEFQELGLRTWMSGGRVVVNKRTWYAHWHKPRDLGRGYFISGRQKANAERFSFDYWWNDRMPGAVRKFEWLIDHFWPVPTWPKNWKELHCKT